MIADSNEYYCMVPAGITLDLNGHTFTVTAVTGIGAVTDTAGNGVLKVPQGMAFLFAQELVPVWNEVDGYYFAAIPELNNSAYFQTKLKETDSGLRLEFLHFLDRNLIGILADGAADNGLSIKIRLHWNGANGPMTQDVNYTDDMVKAVYDDFSHAFYLTISNAADLDGLTYSFVLATDCKAEFETEAKAFAIN